MMLSNFVGIVQTLIKLPIPELVFALCSVGFFGMLANALSKMFQSALSLSFVTLIVFLLMIHNLQTMDNFAALALTASTSLVFSYRLYRKLLDPYEFR